MSDHDPRYVVREQHGTTVGEHSHTWDFLILDSWYCYREVLHVKPDVGSTRSATQLRRRVYEYAAHLNAPPLCRCGCGQEVIAQKFPRHGGSTPYPTYVDRKHARHARHLRDKARRDGRVA